MREHFDALMDTLAAGRTENEHLHAGLEGESSDFVRFNRARVRQAGHVNQYRLQLALQRGRKHCTAECDLEGGDSDHETVRALLRQLRERLPNCPDDPYLNYNDRPQSTDSTCTQPLPDAAAIAAKLCATSEGLDLVGIYAGGDIVCGYANTHGQRNWHARSLFNLDWSCHLPGNRAVKSMLAGNDWNPAELAAEIDRQRRALEILGRPPLSIAPGRYRAYLAPSALAELLELLSWDGFSLREHRTRQSSLLKLAAGDRRLDPRVGLSENRAGGFAPRFTGEGFVVPDCIPLIENGRLAELLVDARSAREYDATVNTGSESPESLEMAAGDLPGSDILAALHTGLYINHLWYGNLSDANNCRMTGLTRYACYWVENGEIIAPLDVMRFDDSLYRLLGEELEAITMERRFMHDTNTYEQRSLSSLHLPGILCRALRLTL